MDLLSLHHHLLYLQLSLLRQRLLCLLLDLLYLRMPLFFVF